ncbi:MAG: hypothetical protein IKE34_06760 [Paenibacillus sp.]|uniref:hypothetical protein n=1 Tax=Paenibacillus aquistagni TaxID=1852522 RepID=UPI000B512994|nr:hypothetical protein [Paenibacillus aquistagni]MBR2568870.1 hypothetical protein [Paenibacillus sp.]
MKKLFRKVLVSLAITLGITSTVLVSFPSSVQAADSSFQNIQRGSMIYLNRAPADYYVAREGAGRVNIIQQQRQAQALWTGPVIIDSYKNGYLTWTYYIQIY